MSENTELSEIANLPVAELVERLAGLSREDLLGLRELEAAAGNRSTALTAIDKAIAALPPESTETSTQEAAEAAAAAKTVVTEDVASAPAAVAEPWHAEDYDGPLTIPQAEWRRYNIKPTRSAGATK